MDAACFASQGNNFGTLLWRLCSGLCGPSKGMQDTWECNRVFYFVVLWKETSISAASRLNLLVRCLYVIFFAS